MTQETFDRMSTAGAVLIGAWLVGIFVLIGVARDIPAELWAFGPSIVTGWLGLQAQVKA